MTAATDSNSNPIGVPPLTHTTVSSLDLDFAEQGLNTVFVIGEFVAECTGCTNNFIVGDIQADGNTFLNTQLNKLSGTTSRTVVVSGILTVGPGRHNFTLRAYTDATNFSVHHRALSVLAPPSVLGVSRCVDSIAGLRALSAGAFRCVRLLGYHAPGDGGGGEFYWDASSSELDNGGTIIIPASKPATGRWKRLVEGPLSVKWFGAKGDGQNDDGPAIQAALDAVPELGGGTIILPCGHYISRQGFRVKASGTTISGLLSAYSYGDNPYGTQVEFRGGTTGFDFCMGLPASSRSRGT
jgi:hypothetical protein